MWKKNQSIEHIPNTHTIELVDQYVKTAILHVIFLSFFFFFCLFAVFWAAPAAYGDSQARGPIRAVAASLRHSHGKAGSELCLQPTPQLMVTPDR